MTLRSKLILGASILLLVMFSFMLLMPIYFVRQDVRDAAAQVYELIARGESPLSPFPNLEKNLVRKLTMQSLFIFLGGAIFMLLFFYRVAVGIIKPIRKLAGATAEIVEGKYDEITLPDVGDRKDEIATLTHAFSSMIKGLQEKEKIRGVLDKVVSKDVADEILKEQVHLGGEDRISSIFFSDIRQFTKITENLSPQSTIQMLNQCMTKVSRVIESEGGVIDKYVGDAVMAIFGAPVSVSDHAVRAISAGILVVETLKKWNEERAKQGEVAIEMGIGIHTGLVVAGNIGAENRLNYTVLGANVNLAERLCEIAKRNQLIISQNTYSEPNVKDSFYCNSLDPIQPKGFSSPIKIYEVTGFKWQP